MFQVASAASIKPARRPTRGSGVGGDVELFAIGAGALPPPPVEVASVSMPAISITCSIPFIIIFMPCGDGSGTGCRRSRSHCDMRLISSVCALMMRAQSVWTEELAPCVGHQRAMTMACAWWLIIPVMKSISALVYGCRTLSVAALATAAWLDWEGVIAG